MASTDDRSTAWREQVVTIDRSTPGSRPVMAIWMTKVYHWCAVSGLMILPVVAVYRGLAEHKTAFLLVGVAGLALIPLLGAFALRSVPKLMEMSPEGLYVKQYKRRLDWRDIRRAYVIDMAERMSRGEKLATAALGNRAASLAMLIGLEFTESGLQKHGVLADSFWQRQHKGHNDHAVIRTHLFALGEGALNSIPSMVEEIERLRRHYSDGCVSDSPGGQETQPK